MTWIQTYSGLRFDFQDLTPENVAVVDIARGLSKLCRFAGQCEEFYSVAEHSVLVARDLRDRNFDKQTCFMGLLHDATEAYCADVPSPLKGLLPSYRAMESDVWELAIAPAFGLPAEIHDDVKEADHAVLLAEVQHVMPFRHPWPKSGRVSHMVPKCLPHEDAFLLFAATFNEFTIW